MSIDAIFRIELALLKISVTITGLITSCKIRGPREIDRVCKTKETHSKRKINRKQKAIEMFYTIQDRSKLKPYAIARKINNRWSLNFPDDKIPTRETLVRYLREEKLLS